MKFTLRLFCLGHHVAGEPVVSVVTVESTVNGTGFQEPWSRESFDEANGRTWVDGGVAWSVDTSLASVWDLFDDRSNDGFDALTGVTDGGGRSAGSGSSVAGSVVSGVGSAASESGTHVSLSYSLE